MKVAINYSPQTAELLAAGRVTFDLYKTTEWPEMIAAAETQRPAIAHFPLMAGRHNLEQVGVARIQEILDTTATGFVNTHLAPHASDFSMDFTTTDVGYVEPLVEAMMTDIHEMIAHFGREIIILENANYDPNYQVPTLVIQPEVITRVVNESGCGFLLDLAHAHMSAAYFGMDTREYMNRLPVYALRELHVAGTRYVADQERLVDHYPMTADDWALTEWAVDNIRSGAWAEPALVSLEYGGTGGFFSSNSDIHVLAHDIPRLWDLVQGVSVPTSG
ncbi:MAG: DUF692 family protein [Chloroflexi bacterium]|nr:DUF692 family protein [Chloroflexota bacterium]MCC6895169.1 DUF692 family protein [Anaerolineae bacterium]